MKKSMTPLALILVCLMGLFPEAEAKIYEYTYDNKFVLLENPESAVDYKIELIKKAKHHIHILTFFWDESKVPERMAQALNEANARGVEVRILTTFIATVSTDLLGKGRKKLNTKSKSALFSYLTLSPGAIFSVTHNLHEKVFIVDGETAIIGGRNVSDSSLAGKDMEVEMHGPIVNQVQDHFKLMYDLVADQKVSAKCAYQREEADFSNCGSEIKKTKYNLDDQKFFPSQPAFVDGVKGRLLAHDAILQQVKDTPKNRTARLEQKDDILDTVIKVDFKKLRMYNYFIMPTNRFLNFLEGSLNKGNSIEVITNSLESAKFSSNMGYFYSLPTVLSLHEQGLEVYQWQRDQKLNYVHEKVLIFDEDHVFIGSHNLVTGSTAVSNEITVEFFSKAIAARLTEVFEQEKADPKITHKITREELQAEISENQNKIKYLRKGMVPLLLREIY